MASSVLTLSSDVWNSVGLYLDMLDKISLWLIGSSALLTRLGRNGGWDVLSLPKDAYRPFWNSWPSWLISQLPGLKVLQISPSHQELVLPHLRPSMQHILELSRVLVTLELDYVDGFNDSVCAALPRTLLRLELPFNRTIGDSGLADLPIGLTALNLQRNRRITCGGLPRFLESFTGDLYHIMPCKSTFEDLPHKTLTSLALIAPPPPKEYYSNFVPVESPWHAWNLSGFKHFPVLSSLHISLIRPHHVKEEEEKQKDANRLASSSSTSPLPTALSSATHQEQDQQEYYPNTEKLTHDTHRSIWAIPSIRLELPETLVSLRLGGIGAWFNPDCIPSLPRHMETLILEELRTIRRLQMEIDGASQFSVPPWEERHLSGLPRTLTRLEARLGAKLWLSGSYKAFSKLTPEALEFLPPNLKIAELPDLVPHSDVGPRHHLQTYLDIHMNKLPRSITHLALRLHTQAGMWSPSLHVLPSGICTSLGARVGRGSGALVPQNFQAMGSFQFNNLPSAVTRYMASGVSAKYTTKLPPNLRYYSGRYVPKVLPSTLTALSLDCKTSLCDEEILKLPDNLTYLNLSRCRDLTDECIPALPHELVSLYLEDSHLIKGDIYPWPRKLQSLHLGHGAVNPVFPPFLTALWLDSVEVRDHALRTLPNSLTSLNMRSTRLTGECCKWLPETLLRLELRDIDLHDGDVRQLPRNLRSFRTDLGGSMLTDDSADDWPPLLCNLSCAARLITSHGLRKLPRTLRELELPNNRLVFVEEALKLLGPNCRCGYLGEDPLSPDM